MCKPCDNENFTLLVKGKSDSNQDQENSNVECDKLGDSCIGQFLSITQEIYKS